MARFNEIMVGRYNRFLQKLLVLKGGPPSPQLSSEVGVGFVLFNGAENRYLEGWDRFGMRGAVAAGAANSSVIRLRNPANSNVIATIEKVTVGSSVTALDLIIQVGAIANDAATVIVNAGQRLDPRGRANPTLVVSQQAVTPANVGFIAEIFTATNVTYDVIVDEDQEVNVLPGDAFQVVSNVVNIGFSASFFWRERFLEESERF
jgi:hypothetical protein